MTLEGKRIVVLGGSSGIGLAIAQAAGAEGAKVVIASSNQGRVSAALKICQRTPKAMRLISAAKPRSRRYSSGSGISTISPIRPPTSFSSIVLPKPI